MSYRTSLLSVAGVVVVMSLMLVGRERHPAGGWTDRSRQQDAALASATSVMTELGDGAVTPSPGLSEDCLGAHEGYARTGPEEMAADVATRPGCTAAVEERLSTPQPSVIATQTLTSTTSGVSSPDLAKAAATALSRDINSWLDVALAQSRWPAALWPAVECIVMRESRGDPGVTGTAGERGLVQIHPTNAAYLVGRGLEWERMYEPAVNLDAGFELYLYWGGFQPWGGGCR